MSEAAERPSITEGLAHLKCEAFLLRALQPLSLDERLTRMEGMLSVLVRALDIKGAFELEESKREIAALKPRMAVEGMTDAELMAVGEDS